MMVGIVYGKFSALYCEDYKDYYWVENGQWGFLKSVTSHFHFTDSDGTPYKDEDKEPNPWRVVIPDMSIHKDAISKIHDTIPGRYYNPACHFISEFAEKQNLPMEPQEQFAMF